MFARETVLAFAEDTALRRLFTRLAYLVEERRAFISDPGHYLVAKGISLDDEQRFFLFNHFAGRQLKPGAMSREETLPAKFEDYILSRFLEEEFN